MLEEFSPKVIEEIRNKNPHFDSILQKHKELKDKVKEIEEGREYMDPFQLEKLKLEKLKLKDEAYAIVRKYL
jgi:uncharacterized protein YdcH (DUF465 family)